jgi:hypothetical protein
MGVVKPTPDEIAEMEQEKALAAQQPPDAQTQALIGMADEAQANAAKARAATVETLTKADLNRANTAKTYAEVMTETQDQQIASFDTMQRIMDGQAQQAPQPPMEPPQF